MGGSGGAGARAPAVPGLTRPCVCLQCTRTTSTDDPTASRTRQRLRFELDGIFNLFILVIWTRRYFITGFLISDKFMNTIEENILECNVSYIYVNL